MDKRKEKKMKRKFFGKDGIRGKEKRFKMKKEIEMKVGMEVGYILSRKGKEYREVIGKDKRR